jgi:hypothetical protein
MRISCEEETMAELVVDGTERLKFLVSFICWFRYRKLTRPYE